MNNTPTHKMARRRLGLLTVAVALLLAACGGGGSEASSGSEGAEDAIPVTLQLGWIASGNQLGEVVAKRQGYYAEEGLELTIKPGGPNIDGVALVAGDNADIGQLSSSPSLMLARSEGVPIKAVAVGAQEHPYSYFSMPDDPITDVQDMKGKKIGTQATGEILLDALLAENGMQRSDLAEVVVVGNEITPLLTGQVDAFTGWLTNTSQLNELPDGYEALRLWDAGVKLYALPYYATEQTIEQRPEVIEKFLRATAKGWAWARENREEAVGMLVEEYSNLDREAELEASEVMVDFAFNDATAESGWGTMDPTIWEGQLEQWAALDQFSAEPPSVDDVMTTEFLDATIDARTGG